MKNKSLISEIDNSTQKILKSIFPPYIIFLVLVLVSLSFVHIYKTAQIVNTNFSSNISYWLTVGDRFQLERAVSQFNDASDAWSINVMLDTYSFPLKSSSLESHYLKFNFPLEIGGRTGKLEVRSRYPLIEIFILTLITLVASVLVLKPIKKKVLSIVKAFEIPLNKFVSQLSTQENYQANHYDYEFKELNKINLAVGNMLSENSAQKEKIRKIEDELLVTDIVKEVSHDLKSPLMLQKMVLEDIKEQIDESDYVLLMDSIDRIQGISSRVLKTHTKMTVYSKDALEEFINFKRLEKQDFEIDIKCSDVPFSVVVDKNRFESVMSNLLNNAYEASENEKKVEILLESNSNTSKISVIDYGKGIPKKFLEKIGSKGFSFGKDDGHGIGIYSAINTIKSFGGNMIIESVENIGTKIHITLPN